MSTALAGTLSTQHHWANKLSNIPTPCYLVNETELEHNLITLHRVKEETNCTILLALKGYATFATFGLIKKYIDGVTASSIYEARLGVEEFNHNVHGHAIAMNKENARQFIDLCKTISVNSLNQLQTFKPLITNQSIGIRINPEVSTVKTAIYDPCRNGSRLGIPLSQFDDNILSSIDGLHFHALCEQNTDALEQVLNKIEQYLGDKLSQLKWMNWGGGHHITRKDYNMNRLIELINYWQNKYSLHVILEPGEAVGLNCGYYVTEVVDIIENSGHIAICDISATCHMPDVLEYPYRPDILNAAKEGVKKYTYTLAGNTCLAGDVIGKYSFDQALNIGSKLIFTDMGHYTIVKTSNFNGIQQPSIGIIDKLAKIKIVSKSCYHNFKERLS